MTKVIFTVGASGPYAVASGIAGPNAQMEFNRAGTFEVTDELAAYLLGSLNPRQADFSFDSRVPIDYTGSISIGRNNPYYGYKSPFTAVDPYGVLVGDGDVDNGIKLGALDAFVGDNTVRVILTGVPNTSTLTLTVDTGEGPTALVLTKNGMNPTWYQVVDAGLAQYLKTNVGKGLNNFTIQG